MEERNNENWRDSMRKRIYEIIELSKGSDIWSSVYDYFMMLVIVISITPLAFKEDLYMFHVMDKITVTIFIVDYLLRLITADYKFGKKSVASYIRYPFTFLALIDFLSIFPSLALFNSSLKLLRLLRMIRTFRVFRVFKTLRYSRSCRVIFSVLQKSKESLLAVGTLSIAYIFISALLVFNVEPSSFQSFFDAIYWATVSLTTMGYGDIYPVTTIGRSVTMISSMLGIAIVALPAGIITAGYMNEIDKKTTSQQD
jgi:voltage-gated potassium channel